MVAQAALVALLETLMAAHGNASDGGAGGNSGDIMATGGDGGWLMA